MHHNPEKWKSVHIFNYLLNLVRTIIATALKMRIIFTIKSLTSFRIGCAVVFLLYWLSSAIAINKNIHGIITHKIA